MSEWNSAKIVSSPEVSAIKVRRSLILFAAPLLLSHSGLIVVLLSLSLLLLLSLSLLSLFCPPVQLDIRVEVFCSLRSCFVKMPQVHLEESSDLQR